MVTPTFAVYTVRSAAYRALLGRFCLGGTLLLFGLLHLGRHKHHDGSALHLRGLINNCNVAAGIAVTLQQLLTQMRVCDGALTEADGNFQLIAALQKLLALRNLGFKIVGINSGEHTDLLDLNHLLILARFLFALLLLEAVLSVIEDTAYGRCSLGSDLHEIQTLVECQLLGISCGHDAALFTVGINDKDFLVTNFLIDLQFLLANSEHLQSMGFKFVSFCAAQKREHGSSVHALVLLSLMRSYTFTVQLVSETDYRFALGWRCEQVVPLVILSVLYRIFCSLSSDCRNFAILHK